MFGHVESMPRREDTPFLPRNPYGAAKLYAHSITMNYRENYGIFAASGLAFNHESPLRSVEFLTRKVTDSVAKIACGTQRILQPGNLGAQRDWGYAKEYVQAMWQMLQIAEPETLVLATGRAETVRDFVRLAFREVGVELEFSGMGIYETGKITSISRTTSCVLPSTLVPGLVVVTVRPELYRATENVPLVGDASRAKDTLGWVAQTTLEELCAMMVAADLQRNRCGSPAQHLRTRRAP